MVQVLPVAGCGVEPQLPLLLIQDKYLPLNSCRAFWSACCLASLQGPLKYPTVELLVLISTLNGFQVLHCNESRASQRSNAKIQQWWCRLVQLRCDLSCQVPTSLPQ